MKKKWTTSERVELEVYISMLYINGGEYEGLDDIYGGPFNLAELIIKKDPSVHRTLYGARAYAMAYGADNFQKPSSN